MTEDSDGDDEVETDETSYLLSSPAMAQRLPAGLEQAPAGDLSNAIEQVNSTQVPMEFRTSDGDRAWLVPDRLWAKIRDVAYLVHDPEGAQDEREALSRQLRSEAEAIRNNPREQAALRELRTEWRDAWGT